MRGAEERERWIRMERSKVKSKRAVESISFWVPFFLLLPRDHALVRPDGRTDGRKVGRRPAEGRAVLACVRSIPPSAARPRPRRPSVHSSLVFHSSSSSIPCEREQVFGSSNRVSSLSIPRCLKKERKRQRGKKDKGPSKSRRRPVSIQASLLLLLLSSFLSKVCRFSPSTHISLPREARDKVRLTKKKRPTHCLDTMHHLFRKDYK